MASNFNKSLTFGGLGTACSFGVPEADTYAVDAKLTLPSVPAGSSGASAVVLVINKNGSPVYTGSAGARGAHTEVVCAANDVISVVLSSALAIDNEPNAVKCTIALSAGE